MSEKNMTCPRCGGANLKWAPHRAIGCSDCGWENREPRAAAKPTIELDEQTALAIRAGARAISNNRRLFGASLMWGVRGKRGGPKTIRYAEAEARLYELSNLVLQDLVEEDA